MDTKLYRQYLQQYIQEAIANTNGSNAQIYEYLAAIKIRKHLVAHREEKVRAAHDARQAFEEHRHWPREIILSQLGVDVKS